MIMMLWCRVNLQNKKQFKKKNIKMFHRKIFNKNMTKYKLFIMFVQKTKLKVYNPTLQNEIKQ